MSPKTELSDTPSTGRCATGSSVLEPVDAAGHALSAVHRVAEDLRGLSALGHRTAGSEGEREMLHQVKNRLSTLENGQEKGRVEGFVAFTSPALVVGAHAALLLLAGVLGWVQPMLGAVLCGVVTTSLIFEVTGKRSWIRWVLPKSASYNLVAQVRAQNPLGSVVIAAPLDSPRWRPDRPTWLKRPLRAVVTAALLVTGLLMLKALAEPWGRPTISLYVAALVVLAATVLLTGVAQRRVAGIREDASAPVALLELLRRLEVNPPKDLDVWVVFTGCAHAYQNGMGAFLAMQRQRLVHPLLVIALDEPGRAPLGAVVSEGPLFPLAHRPTGPALVERLRWAGAEIPELDHESVTDARAATLWGYRALALVGGGREESTSESTLEAVDVVEDLVRMYRADLASVPRTRTEPAS